MARDRISSIASIPNHTDNFSEVYWVVRRDNGNMIERMVQRLNAVDCNDTKTALIKDQVFLDSSLSYNNDIQIEDIDIGGETTITTSSAHGLSSGQLVVLSCAGGLDGTYEVEEIPGECDPVLYLKMNGTDGSTTFIDSSTSAHTVTASGNAQIDTAQSVFGGASGSFDGVGDFLTIPDSDDFYITPNVEGMTLHCWVNFNSLPTGTSDPMFIFHHGDTTAHKWMFIDKSGGFHRVGMSIARGAGDGNFIIGSVGTLVVGTWYHFAFVKPILQTSEDCKLFFNGVQVATGQIHQNGFAQTFWVNIAGDVYIGKQNDGGSGAYFLDGRIDDLIFLPCALWSANFTPPTTEFVSSETSFRIVDATLGLPVDSSTFTVFNGIISPLTELTFSGLSHLEGESVGILADGVSLPSQTVVGGAVTLATYASSVVVGLNYLSDLELLPINITEDRDTTIARKIKCGNVSWEMVDSHGGMIGEDFDHLYDSFTDLIIEQNQSDLEFVPDLTTLNTSTVLLSGVIRRPLNGKWKHGPTICLRQQEPLPIHITSVTPEISVGGPV